MIRELRRARIPGVRDVDEGDLPVLFEHQRDPVATAMAAFPSRDREAFMTHWKTRILAEPTAIKKAIVVDGQLAGFVSSYQAGDKRLVGYWVGREFWGKGTATAALREFLRHDTARPMFAFVATANVASIRVLEKCGFRVTEYEGKPSSDDGVEEILMKLPA